MRRRLLPLASRITLLVRSRRGSLFILVIAAAAMSVLEWRAGNFDGTAARVVVVLGVPLILTTVGASLRKGVAPLWVQKPVDPVRFHLAGFAESTLASVALSVVIVGIFVAVALSSGWTPVAHPLRPVAIDALLALVMASVGFGFCAALPRGGELAALALVGVTVVREAFVQPDPSSMDWLRSPLVGAIMFPLAPLIELRATAAMGPESLLRPFAWVLCYSAVWVSIGALAIRRAFSRGVWVRPA